MKTVSFEKLLQTNFSPVEIKEIEEAAQLEFEILKSFQNEVSENLKQFMEEEKLSVSEVARRLGTSPAQLHKIQLKKANLTLASVAHLYALMRKKPKLVCA